MRYCKNNSKNPLAMKHLFSLLILLAFLHVSVVQAAESYDIVIYGGTASAVTAAVQAKKMGKSVIVVSPDKHLGGLSSGGLGFTDSGNTGSIGGLSREFYHRVYKKYQNDNAWRWQKKDQYANAGQGTKAMLHDEQTMWIFEPHIAEAVFDEWITEMKIPVVRDAWLDREKGVKKDGTKIVSITTLDGKTYTAKQFIDATYEGDLMAAAGVSYHVGREANAQYGETWNGNQVGVLHHGHWFKGKVSPYKVPGDQKSGLLRYISTDPPGVRGEADKRVQAYCYRVCMSKHPENRVPFPKPEGYDPDDYELLLRVFDYGWRETFDKYDMIPNLKTDTNNHGPFNFDFIGENYDYPEASYERRKEIIAEHVRYQQGFLYFISNDSRVPQDVRNAMKQWGLAKDEFVDNGHWPHQLYIREARRLVGEYVMTELDCLGKRTSPHPIGMGSYTLDSHNIRRYITPEGYVQNEGDIGVHVPRPYGIDFGCLLPKKAECTNLTVSVCVGTSHIAFGSVRMEPVFMILGQSAATASAMAVENNIDVQDVDYGKLEERLLIDGQRLVYEPKNAPVRGVAVKSLSGMVQDDVDDAVKMKGDWHESAARQPFVGSRYLHDGNQDKGEMSVTFDIPVTKPGIYEVRLAYSQDANRATAVPVTVVHHDGRKDVIVDQTKVPPIDKMFISLGTFLFVKSARITISNKDTSGFVTVDAVQVISTGLYR
jgi:hypothetical protein